MAELITELFDSSLAAEQAIARLEASGYDSSEYNLIFNSGNTNMSRHNPMEEVGEGAMLGGTLGAVVAGLMGIGSIAFPGLGFLAAGSVAAMFAGAGVGGIAGGMMGWLSQMGVSEEKARLYEEGLNSGGILVAVSAHPGDEQNVRDILESSDGYRHKAISGMEHTDFPKRDTALTDFAGNRFAPEADRSTVPSLAEERSDQRTYAEHERETRRSETGLGSLSGLATAAENEADRTHTALQNQVDKITAANTADPLKNS